MMPRSQEFKGFCFGVLGMVECHGIQKLGNLRLTENLRIAGKFMVVAVIGGPSPILVGMDGAPEDTSRRDRISFQGRILWQYIWQYGRILKGFSWFFHDMTVMTHTTSSKTTMLGTSWQHRGTAPFTQAIEILDADEAHATFSKTYSFLQQRAADDRLQRASKAGWGNSCWSCGWNKYKTL